MIISALFASLPAGAAWQHRDDDCAILSLAPSCTGALTIPGMDRWLALCRGDYWVVPHYGQDATAIPADCQCLLTAVDNDDFLVLVPLVGNGLRCHLEGDAEGIQLRVQPDAGVDVDQAQPVLAVARGRDAHAVAEAAMTHAAAVLGTLRPRRDKARPGFQRWFGWCTWDAFYHAVDEQKVRAGLESFAAIDCRPGFMILDDGWQDTPRQDWLRSFATDNKKFPRGLGPTIADLKNDFGLRCFGLWHCFEGYWAGLDPEGELAQRYPTIASRANIRPWETEEILSDIHMVDPSAIETFYHEWYNRMRTAGVDMVKVDGQSALDYFTDGAIDRPQPRVAAMQAYQHALQANGRASFPQGVLHCMCHSNDVAFQMFSTNAWRNSQDYMPKSDRAKQQRHLQLNATATLFVQTFAWPDWDMFQTHGADSELHAVSRAISGGPVYVCDQPGKQDAALLRRLVCSDGSVPLFDRPAQATDDCLLVDVGKEDRLLKLHNRRGPRTVMALFHLRQDSEHPITDRWRIDEVPDCADGDYLVWRFGSDQVQPSRPRNEHALTLAPAEHALFTIAPVGRHATILGLMDLYAGAAAVLEEWPIADGVLVQVQDGGRLAFHAARAPDRVISDQQDTTCQWNPETGLGFIQLSSGPHRIELRWTEN